MNEPIDAFLDAILDCHYFSTRVQDLLMAGQMFSPLYDYSSHALEKSTERLRASFYLMADEWARLAAQAAEAHGQEVEAA